jgi:hypothetical protein
VENDQLMSCLVQCSMDSGRWSGVGLFPGLIGFINAHNFDEIILAANSHYTASNQSRISSKLG